MKTVAILSVIAVCIIAVVATAFESSSIKGSGDLIKEKRTVSGFTGIDAGGAIKLDVVQADAFEVVVEADNNILPLIETRVSGKTLEIYMNDDYTYSHTTIHVTVKLPKLESLDISGASFAKATGINTERFTVGVSGASQLTLSGSASKLEIDLSGASELFADKLNSDVVTVDCSGASNCYVHANTSITMDASGASNVYYSGDPKNVVHETSGASRIAKR
jgi:hypothetical protein